MQVAIWLIIGFFSAWGGVVRYLVNLQRNRASWSWIGISSQIVISSFTGVIGGLLSFENGCSYYMTLVIAGVFGALGSSALRYFKRRVLGNNENDRE